MKEETNSKQFLKYSQKRIWKWYLILSIIYSSISIITGLVFFMPELLIPLTILWFPVVIFWFIFNIIIFIFIANKKIERIALLLPGLYIFDQIFSVLMGITGNVSAAAGLFFPIIILIFAIYLFFRKPLTSEK